MSYAILNDGKGWRAVNGPEDVGPDERYVEDQPAPVALSSVPELVTMRQARLALLQTGKLSVVNSAIASIPGEAGEAARIEWEFSSIVERKRPYVQQIAAVLGMSSQQLDDLFTLAATL